MRDLELLKAIGFAQDAYILDANIRPVKKNKHTGLLRGLAAVIALVIALGLFVQTPMGASAMEYVQEQISQVLAILFPPKSREVIVEGMSEQVQHQALGREPDAANPGFAIYVDTGRFTMTEENGSWFIRGIPVPYDREEIRRQEWGRIKDLSGEEQETAIDRRIEEMNALDASLPPIEMEIRELPDRSLMDAAQAYYDEMRTSWASISDMRAYERSHGVLFSVSQGESWNAAQEDHIFIDNSRGGCFHIVIRCYLEAVEGAGMRFFNMLDTFSIIAPQDAAEDADPVEVLRQAMRQEVAYAEEQDRAFSGMAEGDVSQAEMNDAAYHRDDLWQQVTLKLLDALERTMDAETYLDLSAEQLDWCAAKRQEIHAFAEEWGGGSLTGIAVWGHGATLTRERCQVLMNYLDGTAVPASRQAGIVLDPEYVVRDVTDAFFAKDDQTLAQYLSKEANGMVYTVYPRMMRTMDILGLKTVTSDMLRDGCLKVIVPFYDEPDSRSFLNMTLVWEDSQWKVTSIGAEK